MLEVVQAGQVGKTKYLFDMHRQRKRVFKDRLGWDVQISRSDLEVDQFDLPESIYLLSINDEGWVNGSWRFLPANGPTMIRDIWPEYLNSIQFPRAAHIWEGSRFAVEFGSCDPAKGLAQVSRTTQELFCGITELCLHCGIREIYTLYDLRIARLLPRLGCHAKEISARSIISGRPAEVGRFVTDDAMLQRLRAAAGITQPLIDTDDLPPLLNIVRHRPPVLPLGEEHHAAV